MGKLAISEKQRGVHVATESLALFALVPFLGWVATRDRPLNARERGALLVVALGTVLVDGGLLIRMLKRKKRTKPKAKAA